MRSGSNQGALLWGLAIAAERGLPLVTVLDAFTGSGGKWGYQVGDLKDLLDSGASLPDALEQLPGLVPRDAVLSARIGLESGTLGVSLRAAAKTVLESRAHLTDRVSGALIYLLAIGTVAFSIVSFIMYYIIPKFKKIFSDFGTELPDLTMWIIDASDFLVTYFYLFGLIGAAISLGLWNVFRQICRSGWLCQLLPPLASFQRHVQTPAILRDLSVVIEADRPLLPALQTMADWHPARQIQDRLSRVCSDVEAGVDCWHSLQAHGMLRPKEAVLLESAQRAGNLPWALNETATHIEGKLVHRFQLLMECTHPVLPLLLGLFVGTFVVGMFLPLVHLISELSNP